MIRLRHRCSSCDDSVHALRAVRFERRVYCRHACVDAARDARLKTELDRADRGHIICRCPGAPVPLAATGRHCAECRRMFSVGVRELLAARAQRRRSPVERLRTVLYAEIHLPLMHWFATRRSATITDVIR